MSTRADLSLSRVEAQNKWAYELAMIASPAVKIEPAGDGENGFAKYRITL